MSESICAVHGTPYVTYRQMSNGILARHCTWDGSLHPDVFMQLLEQPGTQLTPTDKNYKVYVEFEDDSDAEELRVVSVKNSEPGPDESNWIHGSKISDDIDTNGWGNLSNRWVQLTKRGSKKTEKFYFAHLTEEQREHFINVLNNRRVGLAYPGYFYILPFFISR